LIKYVELSRPPMKKGLPIYMGIVKRADRLGSQTEIQVCIQDASRTGRFSFKEPLLVGSNRLIDQ
jgi:hypothetical protein